MLGGRLGRSRTPRKGGSLESSEGGRGAPGGHRRQTKEAKKVYMLVKYANRYMYLPGLPCTGTKSHTMWQT